MTNFKGMEMRKVYAETVKSLYEKDDSVYLLEADLSSSMATAGLKDIMKDHYVNVGIMEANMVGVSAGINLTGGFCFVHSFGQFLARRAMDQIFISLAYAQLNACLVGSDAGVTAEQNGGTHMTFEDMGILRVIPDITIYDVSDPVQFSAVLHKAYKDKGLTYIRTCRKKAMLNLYTEDDDFSTNGAKVLRSGKDITLVACGIEVAEALKAKELLKEDGIDAEVIDCYRVKPLDEEVLLNSIKKTGKVVTCENHNVINGLGSAVAELLGEKLPTPMIRVGARNKFGQVGNLDYLMKEYQLTAEDIREKAKDLL